MKRLYVFLAVLFMVFGCFVSYASAVSFFDIFFDITYTPPTGSEFERGDLGGRIDIFIGDPDLAPVLFGSQDFSGLMAGDTVKVEVDDVSIAAKEVTQENDRIWFSFNGSIVNLSSHNVYAFDAGTDRVDIDPGVGPLIDISDVFISEENGFPIFAFSSPGTEVGSIRVTVNAVPEPSTPLLLGSGLAGMVLLRKRILKTNG